jgi:hypothetical protein
LENFRSIKDEVTLSLVASPDKSLDNNLITTCIWYYKYSINQLQEIFHFQII